MRPEPNRKLFGRTVVELVAKRKGLCFGFFKSSTSTEDGEVCMNAEDVLLLANGCDPEKLRMVVTQAIASNVLVSVDSSSSVLGSWTLSMRYAWPDDKWRNNIHTDVYARVLGYEGGLVEGPGISDIVCAIDQTTGGASRMFRLSWKYLAPLYARTQVVLVARGRSESRIRRYSVCEAPETFPSECRALLDVELETL